MNNPYYWTNDKTKPLQMIFPHWEKNSSFKEPKCIFGERTENAEYAYSDRLWQWDYAKREESGIKADEVAERRTAAWYEAMLSAYHEKPVELLEILSGINLGNGYPYNVFGYRFKEATQ